MSLTKDQLKQKKKAIDSKYDRQIASLRKTLTALKKNTRAKLAQLKKSIYRKHMSRVSDRKKISVHASSSESASADIPPAVDDIEVNAIIGRLIKPAIAVGKRLAPKLVGLGKAVASRGKKVAVEVGKTMAQPGTRQLARRVGKEVVVSVSGTLAANIAADEYSRHRRRILEQVRRAEKGITDKIRRLEEKRKHEKEILARQVARGVERAAR